MSRASPSSAGWRSGRYRRTVEPGGGYRYWSGSPRGSGKPGEVGPHLLQGKKLLKKWSWSIRLSVFHLSYCFDCVGTRRDNVCIPSGQTTPSKSVIIPHKQGQSDGLSPDYYT